MSKEIRIIRDPCNQQCTRVEIQSDPPDPLGWSDELTCFYGSRHRDRAEAYAQFLIDRHKFSNPDRILEDGIAAAIHAEKSEQMFNEIMPLQDVAE